MEIKNSNNFLNKLINLLIKKNKLILFLTLLTLLITITKYKFIKLNKFLNRTGHKSKQYLRFKLEINKRSINININKTNSIYNRLKNKSIIVVTRVAAVVRASTKKTKNIYVHKYKIKSYNRLLFQYLRLYSIKSSSSTYIYNSKFNLYRKLPLKSISRLWGNINSMDLPVWCRRPCYLLYAWLFNCNLNEIEIEDLTQYKNLSEFFRRKLKPGSRFIDPASNIVSPCDGRILHFGIVENGCLEQVKGVNYSLKAFLGEINWKSKSNANLNYENLVKENPNNNLYHCIIYLAPGDYHRFHSPSEWNIFYRRHFPGELFSVNPAIARWLEGLFSFNERAVYYGKWKYGFFSMSAVGATNVGSIRVYEDPALETNTKQNETDTNKLEKDFRLKSELGIRMSRGAYFGEFNLGSTIVLIFEAPKNFEFQIIPNQKVFLGEPLGSTI